MKHNYQPDNNRVINFVSFKFTARDTVGQTPLWFLRAPSVSQNGRPLVGDKALNTKDAINVSQKKVGVCGIRGPTFRAKRLKRFKVMFKTRAAAVLSGLKHETIYSRYIVFYIAPRKHGNSCCEFFENEPSQLAMSLLAKQFSGFPLFQQHKIQGLFQDIQGLS